MGEGTTDLKKNIGFVAALSTVMGTVIGAGVFFKAAVVSEATGTVSLSLLAWFLGGVITICAGLTAAELAAAIPETGGIKVENGNGSLIEFSSSDINITATGKVNIKGTEIHLNA